MPRRTDEELAADVAGNIRDVLDKHAMKPYHLAKKAKMSTAIVFNCLTGVNDCRVSTLVRIADALHVSVATLIKKRSRHGEGQARQEVH